MRELYRLVDGRVFGAPDDPTDLVDLTPAVAGLPVAGDVDIVLALAGARPVVASRPPPLMRFAQVSIAGSPDPGDRSSAADLADSLSGSELMATVLVHDDGVTGTIVGSVVSSADRLSARRGGRSHWPKVSRLPAVAIAALARGGRVPVVDPASAPPVPARATASSVLATGLALARVPTGYLARLVTRVAVPEQWVIAVQSTSEPADIPPDPNSSPFTVLVPPSGHEWADPFPVTTSGNRFLFVEDYVNGRHRGHIAVMPITDDGDPVGDAVPVLERDTHLSYPFVFEWDGAWFLMPEQATTGALELYRATDFPTGWVHDRTLLDLPAADATLVEIDGTWWLFAALPGPGGTVADELHLFSGPAPVGPWVAHPANPVVSDVRTARPAGSLFRLGDVWYRPAQNGGPSYGYSVMLLRIERLDGERYEERLVHEVRPGWRPGMAAIHTLNRSGRLTVIDGRLRRPRWVLRGPEGA